MFSPSESEKKDTHIYVYSMIGQNLKGAAYVLLRLIHRKSGVLFNNTPEITCNKCI